MRMAPISICVTSPSNSTSTVWSIAIEILHSTGAMWKSSGNSQPSFPRPRFGARSRRPKPHGRWWMLPISEILTQKYVKFQWVVAHNAVVIFPRTFVSRVDARVKGWHSASALHNFWEFKVMSHVLRSSSDNVEVLSVWKQSTKWTNTGSRRQHERIYSNSRNRLWNAKHNTIISHSYFAYWFSMVNDGRRCCACISALQLVACCG